MKIFRLIFIFLCLLGLFFSSAGAGFFDNFISDGAPDIRYCADGECGLEEGVDIIKNSLNGIETDRSASKYIQDVVRYLLMFISIIAVIYIIYAGFQILTGSGDEEKLKNSRKTIIYVIIGIVVIWLAWPITRFILQVISG